MFARTRMNVTLYVQWPACYNLTYLSTLSSFCLTNCILTHSMVHSIGLLPNFHVSCCLSAIRDSILAIHLLPWTKSCTSISLSHKAPCLYYFLYQVPTLLLRLLCTLGFLWPSYKIFPLNVTNDFPPPSHSYDILYFYIHIAQSRLNTRQLILMSVCLSLLYFLFVFSVFSNFYN